MGSTDSENSPAPGDRQGIRDCLQNCGNVEELTRHINADTKLLDELLNMSLIGMSERANGVVEMTIRHLGINPDAQSTEFPPRDTSYSKDDAYADLYDHIQRYDELRAAMIRKCEGSIAMTALYGDMRITAFICGSELAQKGRLREPTVIVRRIVE